MKVAAVYSTKGGPGKTTVGVNLGEFCADAGFRTRLIDPDNQPSLSWFYALSHEAPGGTYQLIVNNETRADQVISQACIHCSLCHGCALAANQLTSYRPALNVACFLAEDVKNHKFSYCKCTCINTDSKSYV